VKKLSTEEFLLFSDEIMEKINKDLQKLGIDPKNKSCLTYQNEKEPFWYEAFLDNKFLKRYMDSSLDFIKCTLYTIIPVVIQLEKEYEPASKEKYVKTFLESTIHSIWTIESIVDKFESEKYLSKNEIKKYKNIIQESRDRIRLITKEQNLGI